MVTLEKMVLLCFHENYTNQDIKNIGEFIKKNDFDLYDIGPCGATLCIPYTYDFNNYYVFFRTGSHSVIYNKTFIEIFGFVCFQNGEKAYLQ